MRAKIRAALLTVVCGLAAQAPAQTVARTQRMVSGPWARNAHAMAYHSAHGNPCLHLNLRAEIEAPSALAHA